MAEALGLPPNWFECSCQRHASILLANYYPPTARRAADQLRAGAHTDYGGFTILYQDNAPGGLQVSDRNGGWIDVQPLEDSFVVNIGDLMARWTNDRWVSTLHRVVVPDATAGGSPWRVSIPYFQQPDRDAIISCVPGCEGASGPKYQPMRAGLNGYSKAQKAVPRSRHAASASRAVTRVDRADLGASREGDQS
jgi:isopenicillin N synthase-like dioxygenase